MTFDSIVDAFMLMLDNKKDVMRVVGPAPMGGDYIEIIMDEPPLRKAMLRYSVDLLLISLLISGITGGAGLFDAALSVRASDAPGHREYDGVPRRPGECRPHHRAVGADRRNRRRRARARDHADRAGLDAAAKEPAGRARPRRLQDQPRSAQPARLGAAHSPIGCSALPDPNVQRFAPEADARA